MRILKRDSFYGHSHLPSTFNNSYSGSDDVVSSRNTKGENLSLCWALKMVKTIIELPVSCK